MSHESGIIRVSPLELFKHLVWIDGRPLLSVIEPYRRRLFDRFLGGQDYNLLLDGRAKKNWKSTDELLAAIAALFEPTPGLKQCYLVAFDEDQAYNNLVLLKLLIKANPALAEYLDVLQREVRRRDGRGFIKVLPGQSALGEHGRTYRFLGVDEIHTQRDWDLLEALQPDPTRRDAQVWITSYASIFHRPDVPLFDLCQLGRAGTDPRMLFSWYAADYTTDPDFADTTPEQRANPSMTSWADPHYLEQQRRRLPAHKFRRLHLNLPGLPEGSAFQPEPVMDAIARGVTVHLPEPGVRYVAFVDMSHGSNDDAVLAVGHRDSEGRAVLDCVVNQGQPAPFNAYEAIPRFAAVLKGYGVYALPGDRVGGATYVDGFAKHGVTLSVTDKSKSQLYEALEPALNAHQVVLLDVPQIEQQLLGLVWRGGKITDAGELDDFANAAAGCVDEVLASSRTVSAESVRGWMGTMEMLQRTGPSLREHGANRGGGGPIPWPRRI
jgi:hypothetical protein